MLLGIFQRLVEEECEYFLEAGGAIDRALASPNPHTVWDPIHRLLGSAANVSKLLWGSKPTIARYRLPLRKSLGVTASSPLRLRAMRNNLEHFDERVQDWWDTSSHRNFADRIIGPPGAIHGLAPGDMFRSYDPTTGQLRFGRHRVDLRRIFTEVVRIHAVAREQSRRTHWEP